ncbi:MAG TPA: hypothetical protein VGL35_09070 [Rhizomicrobium sp.]|jgi:hypothetical protein
MRAILMAAIGALAIGTANDALAANPPSALESARRDFAAAVGAHDIGGIVKLSRFPIAVEMYQYPRAISEKKFRTDRETFTDLFGDADAAIVRCIARGPLSLQSDAKQFGYGSWYADCNGNEYFFSPVRGRWLFTGYQNINE